MKHEKAQTAPDSKGYGCFVYVHVLNEKSQLLSTLAERHIYTPRPFIWAYFRVSTTIRYKETAWITHASKKYCFFFWTFWPNSAISGGQIWPNLSIGTSTQRTISFKPIPMSLRPSVTKMQPGRSMTDGQTDTSNL